MHKILEVLDTRWEGLSDTATNERPSFGALLESIAPLDVLVALSDEALLELLDGETDPGDVEIANLQARAAAFDTLGQPRWND